MYYNPRKARWFFFCKTYEKENERKREREREKEREKRAINEFVCRRNLIENERMLRE